MVRYVNGVVTNTMRRDLMEERWGYHHCFPFPKRAPYGSGNCCVPGRLSGFFKRHPTNVDYDYVAYLDAMMEVEDLYGPNSEEDSDDVDDADDPEDPNPGVDVANIPNNDIVAPTNIPEVPDEFAPNPIKQAENPNPGEVPAGSDLVNTDSGTDDSSDGENGYIGGDVEDEGLKVE